MEQIHGKRFTEKGFGGGSFGNATVIASMKGEALTVRPVIMPDGKMSGEHYLFPKDQMREKSVPWSSDNGLYQIFCKRNGTEGNAIFSVKIIEWSHNVIVNEYECAVIGGRTVFDSTHKNGVEACMLVEGILNSAVEGAIQRTLSQNPSFFSKLAEMPAKQRLALPQEVVDRRKAFK